MTGLLVKAKASLWLHTVRTARYLTSSLNWAISDGLWVTIYVLGALAFTPPSHYNAVVPMVFWAVIAWTFMSLSVWVIGNWVRFYISMGVYDEHELAGVDHAMFLSFRVIPLLILTILSVSVVALFIYIVTEVAPTILNPGLLALSLAVILLQSTIYGLILAYASMVTEAPAPLLDFLNFFLFVAGGIAVPIQRLPGMLKALALLTPYSYPSELLRLSVVPGYKTYLPPALDAIVMTLYTTGLLLLFLLVRSRVREKARREGVRGIGRM
ncbi:MAG: ABC transporter permease [Desulfurococcales archaeon]|nr:ABC transporter permease [Desulfurococcales archaeon]